MEDFARSFAEARGSAFAQSLSGQALDCLQGTASKADNFVLRGLPSAVSGRTVIGSEALMCFRQALEQGDVKEEAENDEDKDKDKDKDKEKEMEMEEDEEEGEDEKEKRAAAAAAFGAANLSLFMTRIHTLTSGFTGASSGSSIGSQWRYVQAVLKTVVSSNWFERAVGLVILANALNIGVTIDMELRHEDTTTQTVVEVVLLGLFMVELSLRFLAGGMGCLRVLWNFFDCMLILLTGISLTINLMQLPTSGFTPVADLMESMLILRTLRLLRLARALRLISMWSGLWQLVQGLKQAMYTMLSALVIMLAVVFLLACFGAEFVTKPYADDADIGQLLSHHFSTLPKIMLTLVQFITLDSISTFYVPVVHRSPLLILYFLLILVFVSIGLMNLIQALLVQDAINNTRMDFEMKEHYTREKLKRLKPAVRDLFRRLDHSRDGSVHIQDLVVALEGGMAIPDELQEVINIGRLVDLFDAMDKDKSGGLTEDEFTDGLNYMASADMSPETMQILHLCRAIRREVALSKTPPQGLRSGTPSFAASSAKPSLHGPRKDTRFDAI